MEGTYALQWRAHMHGFLTIEQIKKIQISEFMFRFNRDLLPKAFSTYFMMVFDIYTHLTRLAKDYRVTFSRTNIRSFSIKTTGSNIWNNLPSHQRDASNIYSFKKLLRTTLLNSN